MSATANAEIKLATSLAKKSAFLTAAGVSVEVVSVDWLSPVVELCVVLIYPGSDNLTRQKLADFLSCEPLDDGATRKILPWARTFQRKYAISHQVIIGS